MSVTPRPGRASPAGRTGSRDELLASAVEVFAQAGYEGASLRDIERRAGVGRGLVAHHFGTKEQLWRAAMEWLMDCFHRELLLDRDELAALPPEHRSRLLIRSFVRFHCRHPDFTKLLLVSGGERTDRTKWLVEEFRRRNYEFYHRTVGVPPLEGVEAAISYYLFVGAATLVFALSAECQQVFGFDPTEDGFVDALADVVNVLFGAHQQHDLVSLIRRAVDGVGSGDVDRSPG